MRSKQSKPISISGSSKEQKVAENNAAKLLFETGHIYSGLGIQLPWKSGLVRLRIKNSNRRGTKGKIEIVDIIEWEVKEEKGDGGEKGGDNTVV